MKASPSSISGQRPRRSFPVRRCPRRLLTRPSWWLRFPFAGGRGSVDGLSRAEGRRPFSGEVSMSIIRYDPLREAMQKMRHQLFHQHFEQPYEEAQGAAGGWSPLVDVFED